MNRNTIINDLIFHKKYQTYLEIGVQHRSNHFDHVHCAVKVCVDPDPKAEADFIMTSNEYFEKHCTDKFDLIFIDGLHENLQVKKDIHNALCFLNSGGTIVCHDMKPTSYLMQHVPRLQGEWTGDCWIAWVYYRQNAPQISMSVVDCDYGCGIIQFGSQKMLTKDIDVCYKDYEKNKKEWLNLITEKQFEEIYL
jgi:hypothetical protein